MRAIHWVVLATGVLANFNPAAAADPKTTSEQPWQSTFDSKVRPILEKHCFECHDNQTASSELDLSSSAGLFTGAASGPVVVAGQARQSLIVQLMAPAGDPHMPPEGQLSPDEIATIAGWIDSLPKGLGEKPAQPMTSNHWSFQPMKATQPPVAAHVDHSIDRFIAAKLAERELSISAPADKPTLIRRATFDLIGLPPTPEEVADFVKDSSPNAYECLIDRLLASPRYGERWGRHWLDLARYADSDGFEFDVDRPNAFRYRDYVIECFNNDKPFDRFILEQLAGDEIAPNDPAVVAATGFCRNGPTIDNQSSEKNRLDELDDILSTTTVAFLGLTVGCARCHDHKYDPVTQREYYQLLAVFNSLQKTDLPAGSNEEKAAYAKAIAEHNAKLAPYQERLRQFGQPVKKHQGKWRVEGDELVQESLQPDIRLFFGDPNWTDYVFEAECQRVSGSEGFLLAFRVKDLRNFYWVNFGGWDNKRHGVEVEVAGSRMIAQHLKPGSVETGKWHKVKAVVEGKRIRTYLDGDLVFDFENDRHATGGVGLGSWKTANRFRNLRVTSLDGSKTLYAGLPTLMETSVASVEQKEIEAERKQLNKKIKELNDSKPAAPAAMAIKDHGGKPRTTHLLFRGDHRNVGPEVEPGVPSVIAAPAVAFPESALNGTSTGRRAAFAQWLANPEHPLTARVMVNRIWQFHFGRGIVATPSDFGVNGAKPTHPELLDWLAQDFIASGWKMKRLHKLIMTSAAYRQSSDYVAASGKIDPVNQFLWRFPVRRLEAEAVRDSIMAAAGTINLSMYGPGIHPRIDPGVIATGSRPKWPIIEKEGPNQWRRTVYVFIKRSVLVPMLESFDAPTATQSCDRRLTTTIPTQALQLMNGEFANEQARYMAERLLKEAGDNPAALIDHGYQLAIARTPSPHEKELGLRFLRDQIAMHGGKDTASLDRGALLAATTDFCHVLFNLNEFIYVR